MEKELQFKNINAPIIECCQLELKRYSKDSEFKTICPECKVGLLLVSRDQKTLELSEYDRCLLCGQRIKYLDIQILRGRDIFNKN